MMIMWYKNFSIRANKQTRLFHEVESIDGFRYKMISIEFKTKKSFYMHLNTIMN